MMSSSISTTSSHRRRANENNHTNVPISSVLKNPDVLFALTGIRVDLLDFTFRVSYFLISGTVYAAAVQGLLEACLEPYLEQFHLSITKIGFTFLALSVPYFMASPLWGYICDHLLSPEYVQAMGTLIIGVGFLALGPAPYLPLRPNYPILVIGLAFLGIGKLIYMQNI